MSTLLNCFSTIKYPKWSGVLYGVAESVADLSAFDMQSPSYTNLRIDRTAPLAELPVIGVAIYPAILNARHIAKYIADVVSHCACKAGSLSLPVSQSNISIKKKRTQPLWRFLFKNGELGYFWLLGRRAHHFPKTRPNWSELRRINQIPRFRTNIAIIAERTFC